MITARLAKRVLEHEEGLNHLLIQINPPVRLRHAVVRLMLPEGINLGEIYGDFETDKSDGLVLHAMDSMNELLVEIYTADAIPCGEISLGIVGLYTDMQGDVVGEQLALPLVIADADSADAVEQELDEQVVNKVKVLAGFTRGMNTSAGNGFLDCTPHKQLTFNPHYRSELEKQYRVDGGGA